MKFSPSILSSSNTVTPYASFYQEKKSRLDTLKTMDPVAFEHFIGSLFERMGFAVTSTPHSGDEGIDLWIEKNAEKAIVQCKRYGPTPVGQPILRDLYGEMIHCRVNRAYLVTTGLFSLPAQTWAADKPINLVDGDQLLEWISYITPPPIPPPPIPFDWGAYYAALREKAEKKRRAKKKLEKALIIFSAVVLGIITILEYAIVITIFKIIIESFR